MLLLELQLGRLQAQGFPRLHLLDAAIAQGAPAFLHFGWQAATAALHWVAAGNKTETESEADFKQLSRRYKNGTCREDVAWISLVILRLRH